MQDLDLNMNAAEQSGWSGAVSALIRSYVADWRGWVARLATGYAAAAVMLLAGVLAVFAAVAVAVTALFHFIELRYGTDTAYAGVGGGLLVLGMILLLGGWAMLRQRTPPFPRPGRQAQAAASVLAGSATSRVLTGLSEVETAEPHPMTQVLVGAAVTLLIGWIVASRLQSASRGRRVPR
jgi:hypothetical protein